MSSKILLKDIFEFDAMLNKYNSDVRFKKNQKKLNYDLIQIGKMKQDTMILWKCMLTKH